MKLVSNILCRLAVAAAALVLVVRADDEVIQRRKVQRIHYFLVQFHVIVIPKLPYLLCANETAIGEKCLSHLVRSLHPP